MFEAGGKSQHVRPVSTANRVDLFGALQENECWPESHKLQVRSVAYGQYRDGTTHIAETLYVDATSLAASTSHLTKFTLGYCFASASNVGAMA